MTASVFCGYAERPVWPPLVRGFSFCRKRRPMFPPATRTTLARCSNMSMTASFSSLANPRWRHQMESLTVLCNLTTVFSAELWTNTVTLDEVWYSMQLDLLARVLHKFSTTLHTSTWIYIYIYVCMHVCVCVTSEKKGDPLSRNRWAGKWIVPLNHDYFILF